MLGALHAHPDPDRASRVCARTVREGDFVILDAAEGRGAHSNPTTSLREQYAEARQEREAHRRCAGHPSRLVQPGRSCAPPTVTEVLLSAASCGNLPEVEQSRIEIGDAARSASIARSCSTCIDREQPSVDSLSCPLRRSVLEQGGRRPGHLPLARTWTPACDLGYMHSSNVSRQSLRWARHGVFARCSWTRRQVLRRQLVSSVARPPGAAQRSEAWRCPRCWTCGELRRVREILFDERLAARALPVRPWPEDELDDRRRSIETPASILGAA